MRPVIRTIHLQVIDLSALVLAKSSTTAVAALAIHLHSAEPEAATASVVLKT
jgi:hypothetical protein